MNAIGIGNYGMITGNYTRRTDIEQKQTSTSFADVVQNKLDEAAYNEEDVNSVFSTMTLFRINMSIENRVVAERS